MKYRVKVTVTETHVIEDIEANDMDEAKELAEAKIHANESKYQTRLVKKAVAMRIAEPGKRKAE